MKLCAIIAKNQDLNYRYELYSKRKEAVNFFEQRAPNDFGTYGIGWDRYKTYKGQAFSKTETLKQYKFSICYEGASDQNGYVTEKIFGSMAAGCIPIYWGAPDIKKYVPEGCFIDMRSFANLNDLYQFITNMSEETYNTYLENIKTYFRSPAAHKFSIDFFVENLINVQLT